MVNSDVNLNMLQQFSTLQTMQQTQTDPGARLFSVLPSLGFSVGTSPGIMQAKIISHAWMGRGPACGGMWRGIFVSMDTIAAWNTHDLGRVSANIEAPQIEAPQISGLPIEAAHRIEGAHISGPLIEAARIEGPHISAPSGVGQAARSLA